MNKQLWLSLLGIIIIPFIFTSCKKDEVQAAESLNGIWDVIGISSYYGDFSNNGFNPTETIEEDGQLGTFNFMEDSVDFNFTRNDTLFAGVGAWDIDVERVNAGFVRVPVFTLSIENHFLFDVSFGDETRNSEKNATTATFVTTPTGLGVLIEMSLEKR